MKIAVVGAGPSGAAAAHALAIKGHDVLVLEGQKYVGGRTHCFRKNGFTLDTGAGFVTNFYPRLMSLSHDLEFNSSIQEMNRVSGLVRDGTLATMNIAHITMKFEHRTTEIFWTSLATYEKSALS